jgi:hypothetical protein
MPAAVQHFRRCRAPTFVLRHRSKSMINSFQDFQKVSKVEMTDYLQAMGELNKSCEAIATEMTDYSKRSFEDGVATFQKLATARSVPEVVEIQTTYAKSAYEDYMQQMAKVGAMYQSFAKDAFKPVERTFKGSR